MPPPKPTIKLTIELDSSTYKELQQAASERRSPEKLAAAIVTGHFLRQLLEREQRRQEEARPIYER
jgi:hypothetical protein